MTVNIIVIWLTSVFVPSTEQCFTVLTMDFKKRNQQHIECTSVADNKKLMSISFPKRHSLTLSHWPKQPVEQQNLRSIWKTRDDQFTHCRIAEESRQLGPLRWHTALECRVGSNHTSWEQGQHQKKHRRPLCCKDKCWVKIGCYQKTTAASQVETVALSNIKLRYNKRPRMCCNE